MTIQSQYPKVSRLSSEFFQDLREDTKIKNILKTTSILESLDLSELLVGEHTLAFFLNLWNLLFLHTLINVWINDPPINELRHSISLSTIKYKVGDLGQVSLATLRYKLLGFVFDNQEFFTLTDDINEIAWQDLDLVQDPRVIFAMANEFYETPIVKVIFKTYKYHILINIWKKIYIF